MLWEPHLHPVWQSNIWHVRGRDRDLLVDAGMGIGDLAGALLEIADKPIVAVATHRHADHVGGFHQFDTRLAHPLDADEIAGQVFFVMGYVDGDSIAQRIQARGRPPFAETIAQLRDVALALGSAHARGERACQSAGAGGGAPRAAAAA